jgi:hypothetical protein
VYWLDFSYVYRRNCIFCRKFRSAGVPRTTRDWMRCACGCSMCIPRRVEILNVGHGRILKTTTNNQTPCNRVLISNLIFVQLVKKLPRNIFASCGKLSCFKKPGMIPILSQLIQSIFYTRSFCDLIYLYPFTLHYSPPKPGTVQFYSSGVSGRCVCSCSTEVKTMTTIMTLTLGTLNRPAEEIRSVRTLE